MSNFLGVGFKFPFSVGPSGGVQLSKYETNIEESVRIIIGTALGERQMRPEWGCRIHDFVFAPNNTSTQTLVTLQRPSKLDLRPQRRHQPCVIPRLLDVVSGAAAHRLDRPLDAA